MILNLNGVWKFTIDMGVIVTPYFNPDFPRDYWETIYIPSVWNLYREKYYLYEGVVWFAKEFYIDNFKKDFISEICFEGVNYICEVYLNGEKIGYHEGGYTPFSFDITEKIREGKNVLVVKVDNRRHLLRMPYVVGWFNYGGIHRPVYIKISRKIRIDKLILNFENEEGIINYEIKGKNRNELYYYLNILDGETVIYEKKDKIDDFSGELKVPLHNLKKWSPDFPKVYKFLFKIIDKNGDLLDKIEKEFGVRELKIVDYKIFLNGKEIKLKGINYLPINPIGGLVFTKEMIEEDIKLIKELGVNTIRVHFPLSEEFFSLCDKEGLMVWCDIPIYCLEKYAGIPDDFL
ncbi:MAG: hypothetical protein NZ891_02095 [bacterium]|nr:hypothetical protein [bacterium]MDW8163518.1 glycoside hydrolase family 2 TIM barrel-domain containing protein [Candidatus Omnitrophota bacterium]